MDTQSYSTPVSEPQKRIYDALLVEFFPLLNDLKEILLQIQASKIYFGIYSPTLSNLEQKYFNLSEKLFALDRKLTTPDILFEGLPVEAENVAVYFKHQKAIDEKLSEISRYVEIVDRTLDRKRQTLQNNRTLLVALIALLISVWQIIWPINIGNNCYGSAFIGEKLIHEDCTYNVKIGTLVNLKWNTSHDVK